MVTKTTLVSTSGPDCDVVAGAGVVVGMVVVRTRLDVFAGLVFELAALLLDLLGLVEVDAGTAVAVTLSVVMMVLVRSSVLMVVPCCAAAADEPPSTLTTA